MQMFFPKAAAGLAIHANAIADDGDATILGKDYSSL